MRAAIELGLHNPVSHCSCGWHVSITKQCDQPIILKLYTCSCHPLCRRTQGLPPPTGLPKSQRLQQPVTWVSLPGHGLPKHLLLGCPARSWCQIPHSGGPRPHPADQSLSHSGRYLSLRGGSIDLSRGDGWSWYAHASHLWG